MCKAEGGHDWQHVQRVRKMALHIAKEEKAELFIIELAALLHDIAEAKFNDGDETAGPRKAREFLSSLNIKKEIISQVENIIRNISFKSQNNYKINSSAEFRIVQDADRLDAIGAIG
ncbi:MAG: HD domain-containing protein, partial [Bacteroidota bacterium]